MITTNKSQLGFVQCVKSSSSFEWRICPVQFVCSIFTARIDHLLSQPPKTKSQSAMREKITFLHTMKILTPPRVQMFEKGLEGMQIIAGHPKWHAVHESKQSMPLSYNEASCVRMCSKSRVLVKANPTPICSLLDVKSGDRKSIHTDTWYASSLLATQIGMLFMETQTIDVNILQCSELCFARRKHLPFRYELFP